MSLPMNRVQRVVLIGYCLLVAYSCLRVPSIAVNPMNGRPQNFIDYWLWNLPAGVDVHPDLSVIGLRLLAVTALAGAAWTASKK